MTIELDQEALERAMFAECNDNPFGEPCLCERDGRISGECCDRSERFARVVRDYLTAIRYPQQRAVVEAAREWVAAPLDSEEDGLAQIAIMTAVAALEDRTDG